MHWPAFFVLGRMIQFSQKNDFVVVLVVQLFYGKKKTGKVLKLKVQKKRKFVFNSSVVKKGIGLFSSFSPLTFTHTRPTELFSTD
jgi:hypothetical protein